MPTMSTTKTAAEEPVSPDPLFEQPTGDIADPPQPLAAIAAQAKDRTERPAVNPNTVEGQAMMSVDQAMFRISEHAATVLKAIEGSVAHALKNIDHGWDNAVRLLNQNNSGFLAMKEALQGFAPHTPFSATVQAITPSGYPITLTIEHVTYAGFLEVMGQTMAFLQQNGFQAGPAL